MHSTDVNDQCYLMDTTCVHTAANFGDCDRIQLVIRLLLNRNRLNTPVRISIQPKLLDQPHNQRLWMDQHILTWLNQANKHLDQCGCDLGDIGTSFDKGIKNLYKSYIALENTYRRTYSSAIEKRLNTINGWLENLEGM